MSGFTGSRIDCHVKVLSRSVIKRAKNAGLDAIVYAPHYTTVPDIREQAESYSSDELLVIPGREVFTGSWRNRKHLLAIGLTEPVPDFISLDTAVTELERQNAAILVPHPTFLSVSLSPADIEQYASRIDAVEVFNPKHLPHHNRRAKGIVERLPCTPFTSSYAHLESTIGAAYTEFEVAINSETDLINAFHDQCERRIVYQTGLKRLSRMIPEMAHLFWENSWQKFDRIILQGSADTHPHNPLYGGKFDAEFE